MKKEKYYIKWWEYPILFFLPTRKCLDEDGNGGYYELQIKCFRGKNYIWKDINHFNN